MEKSQQEKGKRLDWYLDARFGMFIHWGAYALAGVEASWTLMAPELSAAMFGNKKTISEAEYVALPARFNPVDFDARAWVQAAKDAGMRYMIITAKHHDGFCMFDAPGTEYKITNTPFGRDVCRELSQACAEMGMRLGFYYSPPDMHHPGYRDTSQPATHNWLGEPKRAAWKSYLDYMESHLRKLLTDYGKVSVLWFDALVNHAKYDPPRFHRLVHSLSPDTLINDRLGDGYDFITPEQFVPRKGIPVRTGKPPAAEKSGEGLFRTVLFLAKVPGINRWLEAQLQKYADGGIELTQVAQAPNPSPDEFQPWETCMTMGQSWAYNPQETVWKSPQRLLRSLVEIASRGGNLLLNVGHTASGCLPDQALERMRYIGEWLKNYGDAIYGTTYAAPMHMPCGCLTRKGSRLYLHVLDMPEDGSIVVQGVTDSVRRAADFSGEPLVFRQEGSQVHIQMPQRLPDVDIPVFLLDFSN